MGEVASRAQLIDASDLGARSQRIAATVPRAEIEEALQVEDLPEPVAYTVTRTVLDNKDALVRGHAGLAEFDPKTAWQPEKVGIPLHPGAEKAYREKGWMK